MADGHVNKCKECNKVDVRQNRVQKLDYYQEYEKVRQTKPERKAATDRHKRTHYDNNPHKKAAATKVGNAIRDGKLPRGTVCEHCGSSKHIHAHHSSYSVDMWLVVTWLCASCHSTLHRHFEFNISPIP